MLSLVCYFCCGCWLWRCRGRLVASKRTPSFRIGNKNVSHLSPTLLTHRLPGGNILGVKLIDIAETLYDVRRAGAISLLSWGGISFMSQFRRVQPHNEDGVTLLKNKRASARGEESMAACPSSGRRRGRFVFANSQYHLRLKQFGKELS